MPKTTHAIWKDKSERHLQYVNDDESHTCQRKYNMTMTLIRVKESKSDNQKHENDTRERECA